MNAIIINIRREFPKIIKFHQFQDDHAVFLIHKTYDNIDMKIFFNCLKNSQNPTDFMKNMKFFLNHKNRAK